MKESKGNGMPKSYFKKRKKRHRALQDIGMSFSSKIIPKEGIGAIISGIISILIFFGLSVYSTIKRGEAETVVGMTGMGAFLLAILGFVVSLKVLKKDNVFLKVPIYGLIINTASLILYIILYFYGIILMML